MRAIIYEGANQIAVKEVPTPQPKEGWALVKVSHAGICGTDVNIYSGFHPRAAAPLVMGHEFSGTLESDGVPGMAKGMRVTVYPLLSCGRCAPCQEGNAHVCNTLGLLGIDCDGGFGEYVQVPVESIIPLEDRVSLRWARWWSRWPFVSMRCGNGVLPPAITRWSSAVEPLAFAPR